MKWITTVLAAFALMVGTAAYGQHIASQPEQRINGMPHCSATYDATFADDSKSGLAECAGTQPGRMGWVSDAADATDCTTGLGTSAHVCISDGDGTFTAIPFGAQQASVVTLTDAYTITETQASVACGYTVFVNTGAVAEWDVTLPDADATNIGMCVKILMTVAQNVCLEVAADDIITIPAGALDAGDTVDGTGALGDGITLISVGDNSWFLVEGETTGTWADGGATCT